MTCGTESALVWPSKHPDSDLDHYVDFERECARYREASTDYASTVRVRPRKSTGFEYEATGGRTATREPAWPTAIGQTVNDGSVIWTCRALSTASLRRTISGTPTWTPDSGVTASNAAVSGTRAAAVLGGGSDGQDYIVLVSAAFSDGTDLTVTCVLPVRVPTRACACG